MATVDLVFNNNLYVLPHMRVRDWPGRLLSPAAQMWRGLGCWTSCTKVTTWNARCAVSNSTLASICYTVFIQTLTQP